MPATSIIPSSPGICSTNSTTACTTISSKCLSVPRRIAAAQRPEKGVGETSALSVREQIEREILEGGPMPFSRYMQICLYDPSQGYYSRNAEQFGKAGD